MITSHDFLTVHYYVSDVSIYQSVKVLYNMYTIHNMYMYINMKILPVYTYVLKTFFSARLYTKIYLITIALDVSFKLSNMIENVKSDIEFSFHWYVEFWTSSTSEYDFLVIWCWKR